MQQNNGGGASGGDLSKLAAARVVKADEAPSFSPDSLEAIRAENDRVGFYPEPHEAIQQLRRDAEEQERCDHRRVARHDCPCDWCQEDRDTKAGHDEDAKGGE